MTVLPVPVIKVYVLSDSFEDAHMESCRNELLQVATSLSGVEVLFIRSVGTHSSSKVVVEIDWPIGLGSEASVEDVAAKQVGQAVQKSFPNARVQCKLYSYDSRRGFWMSEQK